MLLTKYYLILKLPFNNVLLKKSSYQVITLLINEKRQFSAPFSKALGSQRRRESNLPLVSSFYFRVST